MAPLINIHSIIPCSRVNGPGERMVVFFQGCARYCPACFNPETHSLDIKEHLSCEELFERNFRKGIEGVTVSGGEPFLQPEGLAAFLRLARSEYGLSTVVYSGYSIDELKDKTDTRDILDFIDVLIDGPFEESNKETTTLSRGSSNQNFCFLSDRYKIDDFYMPGKVEITIGKDGRITGTGFDSLPDLQI